MQTYGKAVAVAIIGNHFPNIYDIRDDGVWPMKDDVEWILPWSPACDMEGPGTPDPLDAPNLPIPFTANELAAFMLDGIGAGLSSIYGAWEWGPDAGTLESMGVRATKAREALLAAYAALRDAECAVGPLDRELANRKHRIAEELDEKNGEANAREGVFEPGVSTEVSRARRRAAGESIAELMDADRKAEEAWKVVFEPWRKAMVRELLSLQTSEDESENSTFEPELNYEMLATRDQLIEAFGHFTGMDASWFKNVTHSPRLLSARKVVGQGGRGHIAEPLFCPFEVMQWLADAKRRKGRPLSVEKAWELLEKNFSDVYCVRSIGDPRPAG
ncbi:MAG: hypothetical protein Q8S71_06570 [Hydrogenophaga sp.]|jgi:hypothetical protein|nr:hypothetical protein [Hydrogenophaga sp.]MDP3323190.1 hypothetical protein [Hydrogenophaga sp.]